MSLSEDLAPSGSASIAETHDHAADAAVDSSPPAAGDADSHILLRGTRRSQLGMPKYSERIRGRVRMPEPRQDGSRAYLRQLTLTTLPLLAADLLLLVFAVSVCTLLGLQWLNPADPTSRAIVWYPAIAISFVLINGVLGLYPGTRLGMVDEIRRLTISLTIVALITAARLRPGGAGWLVERLFFLTTGYGVAVLFAPMFRSMMRRLCSQTSWWGFPTLVCGHDATAFGVHQWLSDNRRLGLRPIGVVTDPRVLELDENTTDFLGAWEDARTVAAQKHAYWAVYVDSLDEGAHVTDAVEKYLGNVPHVFVVSKLTGIPDHWNRHEMDESLSGFQIDQHLQLPVPKMVKRGMDLAVASLAGFVLSPVFLALSIAVKLTSPGPVFYGHERVGRGNTRFKAWKFRTMVVDADKAIHDYLAKHPELHEEWERDHKLKHDPRVTALGKWMRKWSIDELPQIWNVLRGEMSTVGPRPIVDAEIAKYGEHFETFCNVLPGMTGLWQVCGRNDTTYEERVQLDVYYVHHWSPWLDVYLLARTVRTVLFTRGAY